MLDVGCGTARLVHAAAQRYPFAIGLDPCLDMLEAGRRREASADRVLVCAMAEQLPFATGTFAVVTSTLSIRHWEDPIRGLEELARVLSETGTLVIADSAPNPWPPSKHRLRRRRRDGGPLGRMATRCGLAVIDERVAPRLFEVHVLVCRRRTGP